MSWDKALDVILAGLAGLVSGIVVLVANHFLGRRKRDAEIENLKASTEVYRRTAAELSSNVKEISDKLSGGEATILYDGRIT